MRGLRIDIPKETRPVSERPAWFDGCIVGAVFAVIVLPAAMSAGFFTLLLNAAAIACFIAPLVMHGRERDAGESLAA